MAFPFEASQTIEVYCFEHGLGPCVVANEVAVAFRYGTVPYAMMMATPDDLKDFAVGFSIAEGIVADAENIRAIAISQSDTGVEIDITLSPSAFQLFLQKHRRRNLRGNTSCGICGLEDLTDFAVYQARFHRLPSNVCISADVIATVASRLRPYQHLSQLTKCAHAAAWVSSSGSILLSREDVGRHNALDKLVGAGRLANIDVTDGFALITSRCSYEMVAKAITAGFGVLVAMAAPTALAISAARDAGLTLVVASKTNIAVYCHPQRVTRTNLLRLQTISNLNQTQSSI
jgi:FdhD protein